MLLIIVSLVLQSVQSGVTPTVATDAGDVTGSINAAGTWSFNSIPYAAPPGQFYLVLMCVACLGAYTHVHSL